VIDYEISCGGPKYIIHKQGEEAPVRYTSSKATAQKWVATQVLTDLILEQLDSADDEFLDAIESIMVDIYYVNPEISDFVDPDGIWMKMENYVLSMIPAALHRAADQLETEFKSRGLNPDPPNPQIHAV